MTKIPSPPAGSGAAGRRLWRSITANYTLSEVEDVLLRQAVRVADHLDDLDVALAADGVLIPGRDGDRKVHPALAEARQQRLVLARLLSALRLPAEESSARLQHRGIRGVYSTSGIVS